MYFKFNLKFKLLKSIVLLFEVKMRCVFFNCIEFSEKRKKIYLFFFDKIFIFFNSNNSFSTKHIISKFNSISVKITIKFQLKQTNQITFYNETQRNQNLVLTLQHYIAITHYPPMDAFRKLKIYKV